MLLGIGIIDKAYVPSMEYVAKSHAEIKDRRNGQTGNRARAKIERVLVCCVETAQT